MKKDSLVQQTYSDRLFYSTGELLGTDDFRAEQTYHRRQLARALLHLHGSGTAGGLRVIHRHRPAQGGQPDEVELRVQPGLAVDHAGRLIEVPRDACLRLRRWYNFIARQPPSSTGLDLTDLRTAWRADAGVAAGGVVVADMFLAFHPCPRGYTPAFASGPFDALDASQPSRVRDAYELSLIPNPLADGDLRRATDPWSDMAGATSEQRRNAAIERSMNLWYASSQPAPENTAGVDPTAVLLARLRIPAAESTRADRAPAPDWSAAAWPDQSRNLDNRVRNVLLPPAAVQRLIAP
jgi:hypothetical protein